MNEVTRENSHQSQGQCQCGNQETDLRLPLFVLTGASGVGKSTVARYLQRHYDKVVTIESDVLWSEYFNEPETNYRKYRETWLKVCKNIMQNGKPVLLAGCAVPEQFEVCKQRRYFEAIHYITLVTTEERLAEQLLIRPNYRESGSKGCIETHQQFNEWLRINASHTEPPMELLDLQQLSVEQTAAKVIEWIDTYL